MNVRFSKIATVLSLVVCVGSVVLLALHLGPFQDRFQSKYVRVDGTGLWFGRMENDDGTIARPVAFGGVGVASWMQLATSSGQWVVIGIKLWWIALLAAVLPVARFVRAHRLRRRLNSGLCPGCGYDLRATPEGARCPECGAVKAAAQAAA